MSSLELSVRIKSLNVLLYVLLLVSAWPYACLSGDQTLTLALDPPEVSCSAASAAPAAKAKEPPVRTVESRDLTTTVGRVGIVQGTGANIYRSRSSTAKKFSTVKAETPLAVVREEGDWYGVLMINGETGWVPRKAVQITGYELVSKKPAFGRSSVVSRSGSGRPGSIGEALVQNALRYEGVRYVFGGTSPSYGMDCSAFVRLVFSEYGIRLPRTAREQALVGNSVPFDQLQPGDRLYFSCKNSYIDHCGIYAGGGYFVHCSSSHGGVAIDPLSSAFYWRSLIVAKRS